ncbi:hypothetical protein Zm00014a_040877 [Zea mays]|uniref:Uncharacterized protein n=1 Tax=Zea mays TaxID=4577 RepID=A0A3L6FGW2_MAIZE|nr:hypothetical protein Zm00014a_040877 [Zea mays]
MCIGILDIMVLTTCFSIQIINTNS